MVSYFPMDILIIGGTAFLGRALVESGLAAGHHLTILHRGRTNPGSFPQVEEILGDRDRRLNLLTNRHWHAVIDTCGYFPRQARAAAAALQPFADQYTFISTISAYESLAQKGVDENAPLARLPAGLSPDSLTEVGEFYGPLKALCEAEVRRAFPANHLIIRPGLIVGPHDLSDRFTYWPWRIAQGGETLAPASPARAVQFIDVRDLASWIIHLLETEHRGAFNATSQPESIPLGSLFDTCRRVSGSDARFTWADDEFLLSHDVGPWIELPLWLPASDPETHGLYAVSVEKALKAGLTFRPLAQTVRDALTFAQARPAGYTWRAGLAPEKEAALLKLLHTR